MEEECDWLKFKILGKFLVYNKNANSNIWIYKICFRNIWKKFMIEIFAIKVRQGLILKG